MGRRSVRAPQVCAVLSISLGALVVVLTSFSPSLAAFGFAVRSFALSYGQRGIADAVRGAQSVSPWLALVLLAVALALGAYAAVRATERAWRIAGIMGVSLSAGAAVVAAWPLIAP